MTRGVTLITGVSGYLGQWLLHTFVEQHHRVRAVLRTPNKMLQSVYMDLVEFVIIPDLTVDGAYDGVLSEVQYIVHSASPVPRMTEEFKMDVIDPALAATRVILEAAHKHGTSVKRITLTSSVSALHDIRDMDHQDLVVNEKNQLPANAEQVKYESLFDAYMASKSIADRFAFDFVRQNSPKFDIMSLYPTYIIGRPFFDDCTDINANTSSRILAAITKRVSYPFYPKIPLSTVHVKDAALAHHKVLNMDIPGNQKFIVTAEDFVYSQLYDLAKRLKPDGEYDKFEGLPGKFAGHFDNTKSIKILGMQYRPFKQTFKELLDFYF